MPHQLGEHRSQLGAFVRIEWGERHVLYCGERELEVEVPVPPSTGETDDVPASVARIGSTFDEMTIDQFVENGHDVAAIQTAPASQLDLAGRPVLVERGEDAVVVSASIGGVEPVEHDAVDVSRSLTEKEARKELESGRTGWGIGGGHATESTFGHVREASFVRCATLSVRGDR